MKRCPIFAHACEERGKEEGKGITGEALEEGSTPPFRIGSFNILPCVRFKSVSFEGSLESTGLVYTIRKSNITVFFHTRRSTRLIS